MLKNRDRPDEYASHAYVTFVDPKITKEIASKTEPLRFMARDLEIQIQGEEKVGGRVGAYPPPMFMPDTQTQDYKQLFNNMFGQMTLSNQREGGQGYMPRGGGQGYVPRGGYVPLGGRGGRGRGGYYQTPPTQPTFMPPPIYQPPPQNYPQTFPPQSYAPPPQSFAPLPQGIPGQMPFNQPLQMAPPYQGFVPKSVQSGFAEKFSALQSTPSYTVASDEEKLAQLSNFMTPNFYPKNPGKAFAEIITSSNDLDSLTKKL